MSIKYEILKRGAKLIGIKKRSQKPVSEIIEIKKKENAKIAVPDIKDENIASEVIGVMGFKVLRLKHKKKTEKANLFIIGGGMVSAPKPMSIRKALRICKETGIDLYIPYYPLCTDYPVSKAYEMIYETYKKMLEEYEPENISLLGTSSGGNLALGLIAYMNDIQSPLPRPHYILAISPGTCPSNEEEKKRMRELDEKDVAISAKYMITAEEIMRHGEEVPDYMIRLQNGDFTGCPQTDFIYGTEEVLYAVAPSFRKAMEKYHVNARFFEGERMFHCYPVFPICKEAKEGWDLMVKLLKENG